MYHKENPASLGHFSGFDTLPMSTQFILTVTTAIVLILQPFVYLTDMQNDNFTSKFIVT